MKNQVYLRITFWSYRSCETLQFALIPKPLTTKTFWHVEIHVSMSRRTTYYLYMSTNFSWPAQSSSKGQFISKANCHVFI